MTPSLATISWTPHDSGERGEHSDRGIDFVLDLDGDGELKPESLGLDSRPFAFSLEPSELAIFLKPRFLRWCLARSDSIWFVDRSCIVVTDLSEPIYNIDLVPAVHPSIAPTDPQSWIEAGARGITGCLLALQASSDALQFLDAWEQWMLTAYVRRPTESPSAHESLFLRVAPNRFRGLGVRSEFLFVETDDLDHIDGRTTAPVLRVMDGPGAVRPNTEVSATRLARDLFRAVDPIGARWLASNGSWQEVFRSWAEGLDSNGIPRFGRALYWSRADLVRDFNPRVVRAESFAAWLRTNGVGMTPFEDVAFDQRHRSIVSRVSRRLRSIVQASNPPTIASPRQSMPRETGVNVVGYVRATSGLGEAARSTVDAVEQLGLELSVVDLTASIPTAAIDASYPEHGAPFDTTVFHINPPALLLELDRGLHLRAGADRLVGCFFWETENVPRTWIPAFDLVDELWAASGFLADAFRRATEKPIKRLRAPFRLPGLAEPNRQRFGWHPDEFVVVFVADALSGLDRKNPIGLIDAFEGAFAPRYEGVRMVLKLNHATRFPIVAERINALGDAPVELLGQPMARNELLQFMASSSLYVSLHRSEGLGLTLLEAMSQRVPVMATAYGGNTDFMDDTCGLLVDWSFTPAMPRDGSPYRGQHWAEPNISTAVDQLRAAKDDPLLLSRLASAGRQRVETMFPLDGHVRSVGSLLGVEINDSGGVPIGLP